MASEDRAKELEAELLRERVARRIVDAALRDLMEERDILLEAGKVWLAETNPGQRINTAKGRHMMKVAVENVAKK